MSVYLHTQPGTVLRWTMGIILMASLISAFVLGKKDIKVVLFFVSPLMLGILTLFWSLTIEVTKTHLTHAFNFNFWKRSYKLSEIQNVTKGNSAWYNGYGIRYVGSGWLYNVSGTDIIIVEFKDSSHIWLGTDDQETVYTILSESIVE